jgi:predicted nuclease with TOPRIM domain
MHNELFEHFNNVVQENIELMSKLELAEAKIANLKSTNERLEYGFQALSDKLEDANNEINRLGMVLKHRTKDMPPERWIRTHNDMLAARRHH